MINTNTEPKIIIDADARKIIIPTELEYVAVSLDNNAETLIIQAPLKFDDVDLSEKNVKIVYKNANDEYGEFIVTTKTMSDDALLLSWQLENKFTKYGGKAKFAVVFYDDEGYRWSTQSATVSILEGISDGNSAMGINVETAVELINKVNESLDYYNSFLSLVGTLQDAVSALNNSVVTNTENVSNHTSQINSLVSIVDSLNERVSVLES